MTVFAATLAMITYIGWIVTFYISAAIYMMGALCWLFLDTHTPIEGPIAAGRAA